MSKLYEHGTLAALMAGNMAGTIAVGDLLKHGNTGIGTFDGLNGEVIILNDEVYQAVSDGHVNHVTERDAKMPFASVHFPDKPTPVTLQQVNFDLLNGQFVDDHQLANVFAFLKLSGHFEKVHTRIAPKQERPYPSLLEVAKGQPEFHRQDIDGTILGYYAPDVFGSITAAGWHLHFISDDRQFAGHLLGFSADQLKGDFEIFDTLEQHLPVEDQDYRQSKVDLQSLRAGIAAAEGSK